MRLSSITIPIALLIPGALSFAACSTDDSCSGYGNCADGGTSGLGGSSGASGTSGQGGAGGSAGGSGGSAGDGGGCDTSRSPSEEACLVSDEHAVFVSPSGSDGAAGTKTAPLKSITEAVTVAGGSKVVIVCNGTFDEHVKIADGAKVYGGFDCSTWAFQSGTTPSVEPTTEGYALEIDSVSAPVVIEDVAFKTKDASAAGGSSVGAFVNASTNVSLSRVKLEAGKGLTGTDGALAAFTFPPQADLNGNSANLTAGGALKTCACPAGDQSIGGIGGSAAPGGQDGTDGQPPLGGGQGGDNTKACGSGGAGLPGAPASVASDGQGAATRGTLLADGWSPSAGGKGNNGGPGQGGGGGASTATSGGGGGGCGGCGGAGGPGGGGGGASVALLVLDSAIAITASELVSADAGGGGKGTAGQSGQTEVGFGGLQAVGACSGGNGAAGGNGGAGGGGAGGISVGIAYAGATAPVVDGATTFTLGNAGAAGIGGKPGVNNGVAGVAENLFEVQ